MSWASARRVESFEVAGLKYVFTLHFDGFGLAFRSRLDTSGIVTEFVACLLDAV